MLQYIRVRWCQEFLKCIVWSPSSLLISGFSLTNMRRNSMMMTMFLCAILFGSLAMQAQCKYSFVLLNLIYIYVTTIVAASIIYWSSIFFKKNTVGRHELMDSKSSITAPINSTSSDERKVVLNFLGHRVVLLLWTGEGQLLLLLSEWFSERALPLDIARVQVQLCHVQAQMLTSAISSIVMQSRLHRVDRCMQQARTTMLLSSTIKKRITFGCSIIYS